MTLVDELRSTIQTSGPIPFEQFQWRALYDPRFGFFSGAELRSTKSGDFLTSPEVSPLFGETIAEFVAGEMPSLSGGCVIEVGAGSGSLLSPLMSALDAGIVAWAVEASPAARRALEAVAPNRVVSDWSELPRPISGVVIANELLDNLPVSLARRVPSGWVEEQVGLNGERLVLVQVPARPDVAAWAEEFGAGTPVGGLVEVQLEAQAWVERVVGDLETGALLVIDYGDTTEGLVPRRSEGTLRTYRSHHLGPDPLLAPGDTDITVDVNFSAIGAAALSAGASVEIMRQDEFLSQFGLRQRLRDLRMRELELAKTDQTMERLRIRSAKTEAETLLHPRGLGDFRVLIARIRNRR